MDYISWRRVSTKKQGKSGLGLEAQKNIISYFVKAENGTLIADYEEAYTGKDLQGCSELQKAIRHCKKSGATLVIAKSDRFRNCQEALGILDAMDGNIMFCDLPHTDRFTLTLFFAMAEREALIIGLRTKQALAVRKAQGKLLGRKALKYTIRQDRQDAGRLQAAKTRTNKSLSNPEFQSFCRILKRVFPILEEYSTDEDFFMLGWAELRNEILKQIDNDKLNKVFELMKEANLNNHELFSNYLNKSLLNVRAKIGNSFGIIQRYLLNNN